MMLSFHPQLFLNLFGFCLGFSSRFADTYLYVQKTQLFFFCETKTMDRFRNKQMDIPLCKFGPGGEYINELHADDVELHHQPDDAASPLGKVLYAIADVIGATVQPEMLMEIACALPIEDEQSPTCSKESQQDAQPANRRHPQTTSGPCANWKLSKEPLLFSNDWGTGTETRHKSGHRVRTHRRPARKKADGAIHGQGSLFEADRKRRKTA
jgi:hypothetical protein